MSAPNLRVASDDAEDTAEVLDLAPRPADYERALVGALCWSTHAAAAAVLSVLDDDDVTAGPARYAVTRIREVVAEGHAPDAHLVWDAASRAGLLEHEKQTRQFAAFMATAVDRTPPHATAAAYAGVVLRHAERRAVSILRDTLEGLDPDTCGVSEVRAAATGYLETAAHLDTRIARLRHRTDQAS